MSIASEIQDLNTNLAAAKSAVTAKGGTVGDTGLAGLATEIASIPSGGSPSDETAYGVVYYNDVFVANVQDIYSDGCTATVGDLSLLTQFALKNPDSSSQFYLDFEFEQGSGWRFRSPEGDVYYTTEELLEVVGIKVTDFDESTAEFAMINVSATISIDYSQPAKRKVLNSIEEFNSLTSVSSNPIVPLKTILRFVFGKNITTVPSRFLSNTENLQKIETEYATGVLTISDYVFTELPKLEASKIEFPNATSIGDSFLSNNGFAGEVVLPKVKSIGNDFLATAYKIPELPEVETIGQAFMRGTRTAQVFLNKMPKLKTLGERAFISSYVHEIRIYNYALPNLVSIGAGFCDNCPCLGYVAIDSTAIINKMSNDSSWVSFASSKPSDPTSTLDGLSYRGGMLFNGGQDVKTALLTKFPNSSVSGCWRKWVS